MSKSVANFVHALAAVLIGNAAYFLFARYLPPRARHAAFQIDLGMVVDFCICLAVLGLIKAMARSGHDSRPPRA